MRTTLSPNENTPLHAGPPAVTTVDAMRPGLLRLTGLVKQFGDDVVVDGVDLDIAAGAVVGLVGDAGSGRSTVLCMAMGLLPPDEGTVRVGDTDIWATDTRHARDLVGMLPDSGFVPDWMTGRELLVSEGLEHGMPIGSAQRRAGELITTLRLVDVATSEIAEYTEGQRRRLRLAAALVHRPAVLVLDDVFAGIDEGSAAVVRTVLRDFAGNGGAVLLSGDTEVGLDRVCDHVRVIEGGRMVPLTPAAPLTVRPAPGVRVTVLEDGGLELRVEATGARYRYDRDRTAMWIALRTRDGRLDRAAELLAENWGRDRDQVHADLVEWVLELAETGLVA
ncbi:ABC-type multidrug transport system ATPase subunit [Herbihabitans rhizosphaerae]|uniref:ABC-type multidrug transport system ATPase subunit n=1 Tax=Herbihabitans rhizosphaerae TaxID=1872711 RepID=A0A4Q7KL01_9PSEU|nr:ATP-binding cassette domain-containing protein [Herbihabitans rhizosphaerae]RZS36570.1 ABC-type multidrug transport system ATPase subunit [Herbihabitans rhizosphaerae]